MSIVAITLEKIQHTAARLENPSLKLTEDMKTAATDESSETWEHLAAEMQKIGYARVWPIAFELVGKNCPKSFTALKQKVVSGAVAECVAKFADKRCFEGERLDKSMKRIGAIFLLAQRVDRVGFVQTAFAPIFTNHGIPVPDYLKLEWKQPVRKNTSVVHRPGQHERPRKGALEMFKYAPEEKVLVENRRGEWLPVKKHKPIVPLTDEQKAMRAKLAAERKAAKAAKAAAEAGKKKDDKKQQGKRKQK